MGLAGPVKLFCTRRQGLEPRPLRRNLFFTIPANTSGVPVVGDGTDAMRTLAIFLVVLAMAKVATVHWLYRAASDDVIVSAYRPRALEACGRDGRRVFGLDAAAWAQPTQIHLEIGKRGGDVQLWQVDDPAWPQRWRNPYLHLTVATAGVQFQCAYDVVGGTAATSKI